MGNTLAQGASQQAGQLREMGKRVPVLTNSTTFPAEQTLQKFTLLGFDFRLQDIVSSHAFLSLAPKDQPDADARGIMSAADADEDVAIVGGSLHTDVRGNEHKFNQRTRRTVSQTLLRFMALSY